MSVMSVEHRGDLSCHPSVRSRAVRAIQVRVRRSTSAELAMSFRLHGNLARIQLPSPGVPRVGAELWRHTCFEAFIAVEGRPDYHEFNFAPSREWAAYAFRKYRDRASPVEKTVCPQIAVHSSASQFDLNALVRLDLLSSLDAHARLRVGLSAVVEADDGFSYWALRHPADKPDFHDAIGFALVLEPTGSGGFLYIS